ncbi:TPA: hypothetical protein QIT83_004018, partial [Acinetobacter baumannii]|nr:hypothetical protein [Acinetobacter baumannii]
KKSSDNQYHFVSTSSDFFHQQHLFWLRQQEQIRRHKRDANKGGLVEITGGEHEYSEMRNREKMEVVRTDRPEGRRVQQQYANSAGNELNDVRSAIIADYRAATAAAQRATETARASLAAYTAAGADYQRARELHENFSRETQRSGADREEISADSASALRTDNIATFFAKTTRELGISAARATERVSDEFEYRFRSETTDPQRATDFSSDRDRKAVETYVREDYRENAFSRAVSTKISGVNPTGILKALDELDRRRELQLEQQRKNDRGYDSLSPF